MWFNVMYLCLTSSFEYLYIVVHDVVDLCFLVMIIAIIYKYIKLYKYCMELMNDVKNYN